VKSVEKTAQTLFSNFPNSLRGFLSTLFTGLSQKFEETVYAELQFVLKFSSILQIAFDGKSSDEEKSSRAAQRYFYVFLTNFY
jgi:hypothetical protein